MNTKIIDMNELAERAREFRNAGKKLVVTNGCFDLLHVGHVRCLKAARALGDALAIGLNSDRSVRALKGVGRPLNNERDRAEVLAALEFVDFVTIFPEIRATRFIEATRPAVYAKGGDYTSETLDAEEKTVLREIGAEVCILPFVHGCSTSGLLEQLRKVIK